MALQNFLNYNHLNIFRHNDLAWNIRQFIHNKLKTVNFSADLTEVEPWAKSKWSHTDIPRLVRGKLGAQVSENIII